MVRVGLVSKLRMVSSGEVVRWTVMKFKTGVHSGGRHKTSPLRAQSCSLPAN